MGNSPAFQFYPNDWLSSPAIMLMTPAEEGAYIRLLSICWMNNGLPDDDKELEELSRLGKEWEKSAKKIRSCFVKRRGKLINKRQEKERKKQRIWSQKSRQGGISSAKSRKDKALEQKGDSKGGCQMVDVWLQPKGNTSTTTSITSSSSTPKPKKDIELSCNNKENSSDSLVLGLRITEFVEESFKPFNAREMSTFRNVCRHLTAHASDKSPMAFMADLQGWVKSSKLPTVKVPKAMFVEIVKKETNFKKQDMVL